MLVKQHLLMVLGNSWVGTLINDFGLGQEATAWLLWLTGNGGAGSLEL